MADLKCPNCGCPCASGDGGKAVCAQCGGSFVWNGPEAKLVGVGEIDELKETVDKQGADLEELKKRLPASSPAAAAPEETGDTDDRDDVEDDDEEDL